MKFEALNKVQDYDATAHISYVSWVLSLHGAALKPYVSARKSSAPRMLVRLASLYHSSIYLSWSLAPAAIFIAGGLSVKDITLKCSSFVSVIGTGLLGWLLNIVVVLCSGPLCVLLQLFDAFIPDTAFRSDLPGPSGSAFLQACDVSVFPCLR